MRQEVIQTSGNGPRTKLIHFCFTAAWKILFWEWLWGMVISSGEAITCKTCELSVHSYHGTLHLQLVYICFSFTYVGLWFPSLNKNVFNFQLYLVTCLSLNFASCSQLVYSLKCHLNLKLEFSSWRNFRIWGIFSLWIKMKNAKSGFTTNTPFWEKLVSERAKYIFSIIHRPAI